ncbi:MAG TPA: glycosyltransferase family 39 protein [Dongiaceae bacterium]|nr:glycosyltransferase family 39 protein [Dongiaceae bacterium]
MPARDFSTYFLYRWRYVIGYTMVGLLLAGLLLFAGLYLPGALSQSEVSATVTSASLSLKHPETLAVANLPFYLLQAGILKLFGVTLFAIKLPALILGLFSAIGFILLLRRWFKPNIAVLASLIAISTGQFLFIAQSGTASILYIFWPITLLLLGTQVTRTKRFRFIWKLLFAMTAALSLYTPLSIYPIIAIILAIILHPHLRAILRRLSKARLTVVAIVFALLVTPLVYFTIKTPSLGITLLGIPTSWPVDLVGNIITLLKQYFLFWQPGNTTVMTPVFGLGSALLIVLGLYRLVRTRDTTRSYLIIIWLICLTPVLLLNPSFTSVTFVPSVLMLAAGLTSLISYWYRLFPRNPYARVSGLIPIIVLVVVLIVTGLARYVYGYHYSPTIAPLFSKDLALLPKNTKELVVGDDEKPFYQAVAKYRPSLTVTDVPTGAEFTATHEARKDMPGYTVERIIVSARTADADRFYVYQKTAK